MFCRKGKLFDFNGKPIKSCFLDKCGSWSYVGSAFAKYFSKSGRITGAWLAAAAACRAGLRKRASKGVFFNEISGSGSYSYANSSIILSKYFETSSSIRVYYGAKGSKMVVPPGYSLAVFMSSDGSVESEYVYEGQVLTFRSNIVLGSVPEWVETLYDQFYEMVINAITPCEGQKIRGIRVDLETGALSVRDCGCYESFLGDLLVIVGGLGGLKFMFKGVGAKKLALSKSNAIFKLDQSQRIQSMIQELYEHCVQFERLVPDDIARVRNSMRDWPDWVVFSDEMELIADRYLVPIERDFKDALELLHLHNQNLNDSMVSKKLYEMMLDFIKSQGSGEIPEDLLKSITGKDINGKINTLMAELSDNYLLDNEFLSRGLRQNTQYHFDSISTKIIVLANEMKSLNAQMTSALQAAGAIWASTFAVISLLDVYQDKMCVSPFPHNLCGTQADMDPDTCECIKCGPDETLCPAGIANLYDDRNNSCVKSCCGGAVFSQPALDPFGRCYCVCPSGKEFVECESGCEPVKLCNGGTIPGGFFSSFGLCLNTSEIQQKELQGCKWNKTTCSWNCPGSCVASFVSQYDCNIESWVPIKVTTRCSQVEGLVLGEWVDLPGSCRTKVKNEIYRQSCDECPEYDGPAEYATGVENPKCCGPKSRTNSDCECECKSPEENGCNSPKIQDPNTCECNCSPETPECLSPKVLNEKCECVCSPNCEPGFGYNPTTCECFKCLPENAPDCGVGVSYDPNTCLCCPNNSEYDPQESKCVCVPDENCVLPKSQDENCDCVCENPPVCSGSKTLDEKCECACPPEESCEQPRIQNPENCKCECFEFVLGCEYPKFADLQDCKCVCPDVTCALPKLVNEKCECVCPNPPSCSEKEFLNNNCECECKSSEENGCKSPKVQNSDCACVCPEGTPDCPSPKELDDNCECASIKECICRITANFDCEESLSWKVDGGKTMCSPLEMINPPGWHVLNSNPLTAVIDLKTSFRCKDENECLGEDPDGGCFADTKSLPDASEYCLGSCCDGVSCMNVPGKIFCNGPDLKFHPGIPCAEQNCTPGCATEEQICSNLCDNCNGAWCLSDSSVKGNCCREGNLWQFNLLAQPGMAFLPFYKCGSGPVTALEEGKVLDCPICDPKGACCDPTTGNCTKDVWKSECTGTWDESNFCSAIPECAIGACCETEGPDEKGNFTGNCLENVLERNCKGVRQTWTESTACMLTDCGFGACCDGKGGCSEPVMKLNCAPQYYRVGFTCDEVDCSIGICCNGGVCTNSTQFNCLKKGGIFRNGLLRCEDFIEAGENPCDFGACCEYESCQDGVYSDQCDGPKNTFHLLKTCGSAGVQCPPCPPCESEKELPNPNDECKCECREDLCVWPRIPDSDQDCKCACIEDGPCQIGGKIVQGQVRGSDCECRCVCPEGSKDTGFTESKDPAGNLIYICDCLLDFVWECRPEGCIRVGIPMGTQPAEGQFPTEEACKEACIERVSCQSSWGCVPIGFGTEGFKTCEDINDCEPRYECDPQTGCKLTGYGPDSPGSKSCDAKSCLEYYECLPGLGCVKNYAESLPEGSYPDKASCVAGCGVGACCMPDATCRGDAANESECATLGGTWLAGVGCDANPCQGPCCCSGGQTNQYVSSKEQCEECSAFSPCGTWYPECSLARKYVAFINYTSGYFYECGGAIYVGPKGTCLLPAYQGAPECSNDLLGSVGYWDTAEECQKAYDDIIATQPEGIYNGCDWPPAVGSGCQSVCVDSNDPTETGACCDYFYGYGSCQVTKQQECYGMWQGAGTSCDPNPCPQPKGACCTESEGKWTCSDTTQSECAGNWQGAFTDCSQGNCEDACCTTQTFYGGPNNYSCSVSVCEPGHFSANCPGGGCDPSLPNPSAAPYAGCQTGTTLANTVTVSGVVYDTSDPYGAFLNSAMNASYSIDRIYCEGSGVTQGSTAIFQLESQEFLGHWVLAYFDGVTQRFGGISIYDSSNNIVSSCSRNEGFRSSINSACGVALWNCGETTNGPPTNYAGIGDFSGANITTS